MSKVRKPWERKVHPHYVLNVVTGQWVTVAPEVEMYADELDAWADAQQQRFIDEWRVGHLVVMAGTEPASTNT